MANFKIQKTALAVSALAGMLFTTQAFAQALNEKGSIDITAKVINSTCVLALDTTASTAAAAAQKTLDLGTFSVATVSSQAPTTLIGKGVSVVLSLKEANGTTAGFH
jgi:type 1 fimbria pilin